MDTSNLLREAIAAFKAGQRQYARELLLEIVELEPKSELAWIWLSGLLETREEQIQALENSLVISKGGPGLEARLHIVGQNEISEEARKFRSAIKAIENGDNVQGQALLKEIITENKDHERAWMALSDLLADDEQKVAALKNVLRINPNHIKARERLITIQHQLYQNFLKQGHLYQKRGDLTAAEAAYRAAEEYASSGAFRAAAQQRWQMIRERSNMRPTRSVSPTLNLVALAVIPPVVFMLLLLIQRDLGFRQISTSAYLLVFVVFIGALMAATTYVPQHEMWGRFNAHQGEPGFQRLLSLIRVFGFLVILLAIIIWFLAS